jgi:hypothetical protein
LSLGSLTRGFSNSQPLFGTVDIRDDGDSGLEFLGAHEGEWMRRRRGYRAFLGRYQSLSIGRKCNFMGDGLQAESANLLTGCNVPELDRSLGRIS